MTLDVGEGGRPSTPVSITGLNEAPMAGDHFAVYEDENQRVQRVKNVPNVSDETTSSNQPRQP